VTIPLSTIITKGDFVRMSRNGPRGLHEYLWFYQYKEGLINVPLNWHLALFQIDIGKLLLPWIKLVVDYILRFINFIASIEGD